ncbi:hypothetical protein OPKNFCMD_3986 [Methylobacterium crusticola]|uniref:Uncharacterized protein n=1 Tax=Methylobacterium crusticola TaxID=1697972 RepID=A0ABQ4R257_9HYPH|nr:hypothetical protein [Methylobacterium crusticola]GJD51234.1 hypothetical protein OPKNFCMD_3986 [Methylobacterium crusticola]
MADETDDKLTARPHPTRKDEDTAAPKAGGPLTDVGSAGKGDANDPGRNPAGEETRRRGQSREGEV